ncbi:hypothetical protein PG996_015070 [Apiospora saccharicola]|uniref:Uncharacterized protein n=1 Tax=Apiospora saccharicola TaxID=335842 RepID=A0ABR1TK33_9PEZI
MDSWPPEVDYAVYEPLSMVKGLEHLTLINHTGKIPREVQRSILGNSAETLRSLTMWFKSHGNAEFIFKKVVLPNLQSLGLRYEHDPGEYADDTDIIDSLFMAIDFSKLMKLVIDYLPIGAKGMKPRLRSLVVNMHSYSWIDPLGEGWKAKIRFIASFDTLTTLIIPNSGSCREGTALNPAVPSTQLEAILKHKDLETLDISCTGTEPGFRSLFQSAETIRAIVSGLPRLRVLKFAPVDGQMAEVARALANCATLESVTIIRGGSAPLPILPAFLTHSSGPRDGVSRSGKFVWEEHYRLRRMSNGRNVWQIGSSPGIGTGNVERLTNDVGEAKREVFARDISDRVADCHVESGRQFEWIDAVAKDTSWVANARIGSLHLEDNRNRQ